MSLLSPSPRRTVLSFGAFDGLGPHEAALLRQLSRLGDEIIIGCQTDACCAALGHPAQRSFAERKALLERSRYVSRVIPTKNLQQQRTDIVNYNICVFAMEAHWRGQFDDLLDIAQVIYVSTPRFHPANAPSATRDIALAS